MAGIEVVSTIFSRAGAQTGPRAQKVLQIARSVKVSSTSSSTSQASTSARNSSGWIGSGLAVSVLVLVVFIIRTFLMAVSCPVREVVSEFREPPERVGEVDGKEGQRVGQPDACLPAQHS
jgi:hypothetical protein